MVVLTGAPGNRSDFVAGWLVRSHPEKILHMPWYIHPGWGKSDIVPFWQWSSEDLRWVHNTESSKKYLKTVIESQWDPTAPWSVSKSHVSSQWLRRLIPEEYADRFILVDIVVNDSASENQIRWESFVKNWLFDLWYHPQRGQGKLQSWAQTNDGSMRIGMFDNPTENKIKILTIIRRQLGLLDYKIPHRVMELPAIDLDAVPDDGIETVTIDYQQLMMPDGCRGLIEKFDLPEKYSLDLWNRCLPLSRSDDQIWCLGRWWYR
jgi:hypothetical protein